MPPLTVTFTGVDEFTDLNLLNNVLDSAKFKVEFAVLYSRKKSGKNNRYPSFDFISQFLNKFPINNAIHICGTAAKDILEHGMVPSLEQVNYCNKANRIQINKLIYTPKQLSNVQLYSAGTSPYRIIVPSIDEKIIPYYFGLSVLSDRSGGRGISPDSWPIPESQWLHTSNKFGYAGGLSPSNISTQIKSIYKSLPTGYLLSDFWIDMETGIRTDDKFDTKRVMQVVKIINDFLESV